jgi:hypothetical protein
LASQALYYCEDRSRSAIMRAMESFLLRSIDGSIHHVARFLSGGTDQWVAFGF